jgi:hypothetical protein
MELGSSCLSATPPQLKAGRGKRCWRRSDEAVSTGGKPGQGLCRPHGLHFAGDAVSQRKSSGDRPPRVGLPVRTAS